ncbi:MAG: molybdopterin-dependent oxidoreductase [Candidatus Zixiibacteriota bacterium]|nr:MAG: molybdopterin-dependent oxidoreductase [candidate division Zixibacteria bacterium]
MVKLTINGKDITASPDQTILQVCREQNIDTIPTLCYDDKLPPFGSCFLCVVELGGQNRLFPACATKVTEGMKVQTRSEKVMRARKTCLELLVSDHYADCFGPCRLNCPADIDIQGYMSLINLGKFKEAVALIKEKNPLPSVCGRVCTRKCELNCRRSLIDAPVGIDFIKRYAADQDMIGEMWRPETKPDNGISIAIVGGGPAGLTAAYYLVIEGYRPVIYEALPHMGGMLRYGIPEYRLPKAVLDKEIDWIASLGVDIHTDKRLGKDFTIDDLFKQGYKAVFVGLGAQIGKPMRVENEEAEGVLSGVTFLQQVEMRTNPGINGRVVVVGGGNTAIDAARTSLRLGADEVILLYRRTRKEMPANEMEIVAAEEEGVKMEFLAAPVKVNVEEGRMKSIDCIRMELGAPDESGRRRPVVIDGSEYTLEADWVISAIGQEPDLEGVDKDETLQVTKWKTIIAKDGTFNTDRPGVFAGGDVVTGPADAIDAIAAGRKAAYAIDKYIRENVITPITKRFESRRDNFHKITAEDLPDVERSERLHMPELTVKERIKSFDEVETGYTDEMAMTESLRCAECGCDVALSCTLQDYCTEYGVDQTRFAGSYSKYKIDTRHPFIKIDSNKCIRCGRCVATCSEILNVSALGFVNRGLRTIIKPALEKALHETNCVSCGNCIDVCPTGALNEKMPFRRSGPWKMETTYNICNYCSVGCNITINHKTPDLFFVTGAPPDKQPNTGELCVKGRFGYEHYLDGSRLTKPMIRKKDKLVEVSWDEAFEAVKKGFKGIIKEHGRDQILVSASPKLTTEELYLAGIMARAAIGTNSIESFHKLTNGADYHAIDDMIGATVATISDKEAREADMYLFLGGNATSENPVLGWQLKRRIKKGTPAIVINSGQIDLADYATVWADPRRGTSTVLLNAVMAQLIKNDKTNDSFINERTVNYDQVQRELLVTDIEEAASVCGVSTATIEKMADLLSNPSMTLVAYYNIDSRIDRANNELKALTTLLMLLGKIGVKGSGLVLTSSQCNYTGMQLAGFDSSLLPGTTLFSKEASLKEVGALWQTDLVRLAKESGGSLSRRIREDKVRAAIILGENPARDSEFNALIDKLDFVVVADMFRTETVQMADVFLPLSAYLENKGHLTNWAGMAQFTTPIGEPLNGMTNIDIINKLCHSFGYKRAINSFEELVSEIEFLRNKLGVPMPLGDAFATDDGKAHFILYPAEVSTTPADFVKVVEIDSRIADRTKLINA